MNDLKLKVTSTEINTGNFRLNVLNSLLCSHIQDNDNRDIRRLDQCAEFFVVLQCPKYSWYSATPSTATASPDVASATSSYSTSYTGMISCLPVSCGHS